MPGGGACTHAPWQPVAPAYAVVTRQRCIRSIQRLDRAAADIAESVVCTLSYG